MVLFNHSTRELTAKIVYYGPGLCGKTTNLRLLHEKLDSATTGRLLSLSTAQDRTIYFDLLPVELGNVKGYTVRFQLCTVPGQVFYNETRKLVLKGVDGLVFVVDSQWSMLSHNLESFQNLRENMLELGQNIDETAVVVQYNKRDLPGVLSVQALQESLGFQEYPHVESVAADAKGVVETFKLVSKMTFVQLLKRLQRSPDGERLGPDWVAPAPPNSQQTVRIPAVGAELFALASTVGPAPAPPTESPFETTGSWPGSEKGEVFGDSTTPPFPVEEPPRPPEDSAPATPLGGRAPDLLPTSDAETTLTDIPLPPGSRTEPPTEMEPPAPRERPAEATREDEQAPVAPTPVEERPEASGLLGDVAAAHPAPEPPPPPPQAAVWAEAFAGLSSRLDELARAREEEAARLSNLAREAQDAMETLPGAVRGLFDSLNGRIEELKSSLDARLSALETAVNRLEDSDRLEQVRQETAEVRRLVETRLEEAGGQSRRLSGFLRRALEELEPGEKA